MKASKWIIKNITLNSYFVSDAQGKQEHTKNIERCCCFFDYDEADAILEGLNSKSPYCYTLIEL